jgi:hypothetical protein
MAGPCSTSAESNGRYKRRVMIHQRHFELVGAHPRPNAPGRASGCLATPSCPPGTFLLHSSVRGNQMTEESLRHELIEAISALGHNGKYYVDRLDINPFGCWNWIGWKENGYGRCALRGDRSRAHVVVYTAVFGDIPDGYVRDHLCRNRGCSNPLHLEPVTDTVNIQRGHKGNYIHDSN